VHSKHNSWLTAAEEEDKDYGVGDSYGEKD
jgi:hypothetical protein